MQSFLQSIPVWDVLEMTGITAAVVLLVRQQVNPFLGSLKNKLYIAPKVVDALQDFDLTEEETRKIGKAIIDKLTGAND